MKFKPLISLYVIALLASECAALIAGTLDGALKKAPDFSDAFRSDTTLGFMRRIRKQTAQPESMQKKSESVVKDLQHGPKYDSKEFQAATKTVAEKNSRETAAPKESTPLEQAGEAIEDVRDKISDVKPPWAKDVQKGPNYDSKKAQKATNKAAEKQPKPGDEAETPEQPEAREGAEVDGCRNFPKWADAKGNDCEDYREGEFCTRHGGYGDAWLDEWGSFEDVAKKGKSAKEACCVCGGGSRENEKPAGAPAAESATDLSKAKDAPKSQPAAPAPAAPVLKAPILGTKAGRPLQEQGFSGDLVTHEDRSTMTDDWGREFGPHAGHRDIKTICQEHPDNEWCSLHGYYDNHESHSAATSLKFASAIYIALLLACLQ